MASIVIVVTDNKNGMISNSYNFTDQEIKRIADALNVVYKGQIKIEDSQSDEVMNEVYRNKQLFSLLSRNLLQHVLNTVHDTELQAKLDQVKDSISKLEVREM